MPIELAGITLNRIHRLITLENAEYAGHRIPGLAGTVFQNVGRHSTRLLVEGIYFGDKAKEDLEKLRDIYKKRQEADFLAEIIGQAYFSQVIIDRLEVVQAATEPEQFSFRMILAEYVPPPDPVAGFDLPGVDSLLEIDALDFMDMIQLPDLLSVPDFGDPTPPLRSILDTVGSTLSSATQPTQDISGLFSDQNASGSLRSVASGSISGQIGAQLDVENILSLIKDQLDNLLSANRATDNARNQSEAGINSIQRFASGLSTPNINRNNILEQGFTSIRELLPVDVSQALGGLDGEIDKLFKSLGMGLEPLNNILNNFKRLNQLGIGTELSTSVNPEEQIPTPLSRSLIPMRTRNVQAIRSEIDNILALLPDPLDAEALLQLTFEQLSSFPRERLPLQNLPIYDELRDKLETALHWLQSDGPGLGTHFVQTLLDLETFIRANIRDRSLNPLLGHLAKLQELVSLSTLRQELDASVIGLNLLSGQVRSGSLAGSADAIAELQNHINILDETILTLQLQWHPGAAKDLTSGLALLNEVLEERMAELLLFSTPSPDLSLIALAAQPINQLFEALGVQAFISGIRELSKTVTNLIDMLNIDKFSRDFQSVLDQATAAIQSFSQMLVNVTIEFSMLINQVEQAITSLGVGALVEELRSIMDSFQQEILTGLNTVFSPVRDFLQDAFDEIYAVVDLFNPQVILQSVQDLIQTLTDILGNPTLQETITTFKGLLEGVNKTLGEFSFKPTSDTVIDGIAVVKGAFNIVGRLPLPDSIAEEVKSILNKLPQKTQLSQLTQKLEDALDEIVEEGPKPVLLSIKDKPAELVVEVEKYAPAQFLGGQLSAPYQDFVSKLEGLKPTALFAMVETEFDRLLDDIKKSADPGVIFNALQKPFDQLIQALDRINPQALVAPLQVQLTKGIHAITERLPIDATDEIFRVVNNIADEIRKVFENAMVVHDALLAVETRLAGLEDTEAQVLQWGDKIVAKLDTLNDFSAVQSALKKLETAVDDIEGPPLELLLFTPLDVLLADLQSLNPQSSLIALIQAQRSFPRTQLEALNDSPEKTALIALLDGFDPLDRSFAGALGGLQDQLEDWTKQRNRLAVFFAIWQQRYFQSNGPLQQFRQQNLSLAALKTMMATTIREQLTNAIAPVFKLIQHIQSLISAIIEEIIVLIQHLEVQVQALLLINETLNKLRKAVDQLVTQLNGLDITFIAREIETVFDAVKDQLQGLNPQNIAKLLKTAFDNLIDSLDPQKLLGLEVLDLKHQALIDLLKARDPEVLLTNALQPEYEKVLEFLRQLDISNIIETFLLNLENLQVQLDVELERVVNAYGEMLEAIPGTLGGSVGVSFKIN